MERWQIAHKREWNPRLAEYWAAKFAEVPLLRPWQAAHFMNVDQSYLCRLRKRGVLTSTRDASGRVVYRTSDIAAWVRQRNAAQQESGVTHG